MQRKSLQPGVQDTVTPRRFSEVADGETFLMAIDTRKVTGAKGMKVLFWEYSVNKFGSVSCRTGWVSRANIVRRLDRRNHKELFRLLCGDIFSYSVCKCVCYLISSKRLHSRYGECVKSRLAAISLRYWVGQNVCLLFTIRCL